MNQVRVGVSVILQTPWGYPMLLRKGSHGAGTWVPGGHLEHGESVCTCGVRELQEELGVTPDHVNILPWFTEDRWGDLHYITLYVHAFTAQQPVNAEPTKCEQIAYVHTPCDRLSDVLGAPTFGGCDQAWHSYQNWLKITTP